MATVFIVNQPRAPRNPDAMQYDVGPAEMFGEVVFVFEEDGQRPGSNVDWAIERAQEVLSTAEPGDFIVWAGGDPMTMVITAAILADTLEGQLNYLAWNRSFGTYTPIPLDIFKGY